MAKSVIYRLKEDIDFNKLAEIGWDVVPNNANLTFFKIIPQPIGGDLYQYLWTRIYNNPDWKKQIYDNHKKDIIEAIGLKYNKNGIIKMNSKLETMLVSWRLEVEEAEDLWLGLKSADPFDRNYFYSKKLIDKYCSEEVAKLKELDLIEEIEVEE